MMPKVPISVSGNATLGMTVAQNLRRKTKITITTSTTASTSVNCTSRTEARMVSVRSVRMAILTEGGSDRAQPGQQRFDAVGGLDDVGAGLALDVHDDRGPAVHPAGQADILDVVDHVPHVAQADRRRRSG